MREIKFRAWDGSQFHFDVVPLFSAEDPAIIESHPLAGFRIKTVKALQQFTGLKDKNGKEIYESDVVADIDGNTAEIKWSRRQAQFYVDYEDYQDLDGIAQWATIIGNIYENPELV